MKGFKEWLSDNLRYLLLILFVLVIAGGCGIGLYIYDIVYGPETTEAGKVIGESGQLTEKEETEEATQAETLLMPTRVTEEETEPVTKKPKATEKTTEKPETEATEKPETEITEKVTEKVKATEKATEKPETEKPKTTEKATEKPKTTEKATEKPETTVKAETEKPKANGQSETAKRETEKPKSTEKPETEKPQSTTVPQIGITPAKPSTEAPQTEPPQTEPPQTEPPYTPIYRTLNSTCYLRSYADYGDNIIAEYPAGTEVELLEDGGWAKVQVDGIVGYVGGKFIR